ncbi:MAG TPA: TetR/AcrR family transcriptional regulator [Anaerolineaceae bacterium]|nr:TetR/AcrR family transcriptional regulator [Anaerolineaceae bacterium]
MDKKPGSVEEKIIYATIDCIEKYGVSGATNRRIAEKAGVNLAAINYYFRSKDMLMQRVMVITLKNAFDLSDMPPMPGLAAPERCIEIFTDLIQGGIRYPGITRAHFYNLLAEGKYDALLVQRVNQFIDDLAGDLLERGCQLAADVLKVALIQICSAVMMAVLAPRLFEQHTEINLFDPENCREYASRLVNKLLA